MARFGFIHGKLDIKLLILYLLARVPEPVDFPTLTDLCMCDEGVDYFTYAEAVPELLESGHVRQEGEFYSITDKGRRAGADAEDSLSPIVRRRCDQRLAALRRMAQVKSRLEELPDGNFRVYLDLEDEQGSMLSLSLLASTREDGALIQKRFTQNPSRVYNGILSVLLLDDQPKDNGQ